MAITINTNISALNTQLYLNRNQNLLSDTIARMASGKRIVNASDDPAGLAISSTMEATINGLNASSRNGLTAYNALQTAVGAMSGILDNLQTMNALAVQAATGTNSDQNRTILDTQYQKLYAEIGRLTSKIKFNGVNLLQGGTLGIQIGDGNTANDTISVTLTNTSVTSLGIDGTDLTSTTNASSAIGYIGSAIATLTTSVAQLGAYEANLKSAIDTNDSYAVNLSAAKSTILDADMAVESSNLAKYQVLVQTDIAMLAQANSVPSYILRLLNQ